MLGRWSQCESRVRAGCERSVYARLTGTGIVIYIFSTIYQPISRSRMKKEQKKMNKITFRPAGDRVLIRPQDVVDEKSPAGIIIPDTARKEKPERGTIVAVGEGKRTDKGDVLPVRYQVGDNVMFSKYGYDEIEIDDTEYYVVSESNILGVF